MEQYWEEYFMEMETQEKEYFTYNIDKDET